MHAVEDEDLYIAIANSLMEEEEDVDSDLNFAIRESIKLVTQRSKLDTFYVELQGSAKRSRLTHEAEENYRYNTTSRETLCNEEIYKHLLKYVSMSSLAALYRTSRRSGQLIEDAITKHPIKSLYVDSVKGFKIAARPDRYQGTLYKKIALSLTTLRFRIREAGQVNFGRRYENVIGSSITHVYLNVAHINDVEWFIESYCYGTGYEGKLRVYQELDHTSPCSSYIVYIYGCATVVCDRSSEFREPVKDLDGSQFNALTNY